MNIDPKREEQNIVSFLKKTFQEHGFEKAVIGVSGGIDSATSLFLLSQALPKKNIIPVHLYYFEPNSSEIEMLIKTAKIPLEDVQMISIKKAVDTTAQELQSTQDKIRFGNIMARMRMIFLFDIAKKENALVVGTENKSEHYLAYFTRFGDEASDIEPIKHLFKTQVYQLAKYLKVPQSIIDKHPSAGLWEGQTDEKEFGFSYQEADQVLYLYFEKKQPLEEIKKEFKNAERILEWVKKNDYKHHTPYTLS